MSNTSHGKATIITKYSNNILVKPSNFSISLSKIGHEEDSIADSKIHLSMGMLDMSSNHRDNSNADESINFGNLEKIADIESFIQEQEQLNDLITTTDFKLSSSTDEVLPSTAMPAMSAMQNEIEMQERVLEHADCLRIRGNDLYCFICDINVACDVHACEAHLQSLGHATAVHKIEESVFLL